MKTLRLITLLLLVASGPGYARAETHFDPRAHTPLDQVIVLCATEPGSGRFDRAWLTWLENNPEADVAGAVRTVVSRAGTVRSMTMPGMEVKPRAPKPDPDAIADRMLSLAKRSKRQ